MWWRHLRDGGTTRGSRGEEGTYREKFPVPASRTLLEKREEGKEIERQRNEDWGVGGQHKHWYHKGEVFLRVREKNTSEAEEVGSRSFFSQYAFKQVLGCVTGDDSNYSHGKLTWRLHEHEWWWFNEPLNNSTTVMETDVLSKGKV